MLKFVVLCAVLAAVRATPGAIIAPLSYSNLVAPAPAIISQPSSLVYSSPAIATAPWAYSSPYGFAHLIKKRSAVALSSYIAPSTYVAPSPFISTYTTPLATTYAAPYAASYSAPLATTYSSPIYSTAHLIKKRSAIFAPSTYVAPVSYAASPFVASTYSAAAPVVSTPLFPSAPAYVPAYSHFIKKRSAPLLTYSAPTSFSHQSRLDYQATYPAVSTYSTYNAPLAFPGVYGVNHLI